MGKFLLAEADGIDAGRKVGLEVGEGFEGLVEVGRDEGGLEADVEAYVVAQADDFALETGAALGFDRLGELGLAFELGETGDKLVVGKPFFAGAGVFG